MHWMLEGNWYSVEYVVFAAILGIPKEDLQREKIHNKQVYPRHRLGYMYPLEVGTGVVVGKVDGLHPTYRYLDWMFRKTIDYKGGDKGTIADYSRNLLHRMEPDAHPFSIFDFIWCEIQSVGERPVKGCGFAPYIMRMIEHVTRHRFDYDCTHKVLKIEVDLTKIRVTLVGLGGATKEEEADAPEGGAAIGGASPPPRPPCSSRRRSPPSPIHKFFNAIFGMCKDSEVR